MPEGPEVATFANDLNELTYREVITEFIYDVNFNHFKNLKNLPPTFEILRVFSHGKKIVFELDVGYLISFLGLEGSWFYSESEDDLTNTVLLRMKAESFYLYYKDTRHFGSLEFVENINDLYERLDKGLDIINGENGITEWHRVIQEAVKRHRNPMRVCEFLLEQRYIMGVGNYLRAEIIYSAKIDPFKEINNLTEKEIKRLQKATIDEMGRAYRERGATLRTYKDLNNNEGNYKTRIYGHSKGPRDEIIYKTKDKNGRTLWHV